MPPPFAWVEPISYTTTLSQHFQSTKTNRLPGCTHVPIEDIFWNHGFKLKDMFLDSRHAKIMNPLITHWAGMLTSRQRVALARTYVKDRFNASFSEALLQAMPNMDKQSINMEDTPIHSNFHLENEVLSTMS